METVPLSYCDLNNFNGAGDHLESLQTSVAPSPVKRIYTLDAVALCSFGSFGQLPGLSECGPGYGKQTAMLAFVIIV